MADIGTFREEAVDAERAREVLGNKALREAFETVEKQYLEAMLTASEKDDLGRFRYAEAIKVVRLVQRHLNSVVQNGKLAQAELDTLAGKRNRFF